MEAANFTKIKYCVVNSVARIELATPEKLNVLNPSVWEELKAAFQMAREDDEVCSVLLSGAGKSFCAGFDMEESSSQKEEGTWEQWNTLQEEASNNRDVWEFEKPVVAAVQGYCLGGGLDLINMVDYVIAADDAKFGETEMRYSFLPQPALLWLVGSRKAKEVLLFADKFGAEEAYRLEIVNRVVPAEELMNEAIKAAEKLAKMPTETMQMTKRLLNRAVDMQGLRDYTAWYWDNFLISKMTKTKLNAEYERIEKEEGTKAAFKWLNARFK